MQGSVKPLGKPVKASLKTGCPNSMQLTKPKKAEVHFQVPVIKPTAVRPKTAPGLARRDALKKNMTQEVLRPARHPLKRRSVSASKVQETPKTHSDINVRPSKRKGTFFSYKIQKFYQCVSEVFDTEGGLMFNFSLKHYIKVNRSI